MTFLLIRFAVLAAVVAVIVVALFAGRTAYRTPDRASGRPGARGTWKASVARYAAYRLDDRRDDR